MINALLKANFLPRPSIEVTFAPRLPPEGELLQSGVPPAASYSDGAGTQA